MAVRKLRGGATGAETRFDLKVVNIGDDQTTTTCIIEWKSSVSKVQKSTASTERWPKSLKIFRTAMQTALASSGVVGHPFGNPGPALRTVADSTSSAEFMSAYPVSAENDKQAEVGRQAESPTRLKSAGERGLVCSREIAGVDRLWLVDTRDKNNTYWIGQDTL